MMYKGVPLNKRQDDLKAIFETIKLVRPDIVVECGTQYGGSALYFADQVGAVITIDIKDQRLKRVKDDHRITFILGDTLSSEVIDKVKQLVKGKKVLLDLDSEHNKDQVFGELEAYSPIVSEGSYIIVEDTLFDFIKDKVYSKRYPEGGPYAGIKEFLKKHKEWAIDREREAPTTINPYGYLKRKN